MNTGALLAKHTELNIAHPDGGSGALEDLLEVDAREAAREAREQNGGQPEQHVLLACGRRSRALTSAALRRSRRSAQFVCVLCFGATRWFRLARQLRQNRVS